MADTFQTTVTMIYQPATSTDTVENPVIYSNTTAPTQKTSGLVSVTTSGLTVDLSAFTTVQTVFVTNLDSTNTLDVEVRPDGAGSTPTFVVNPGGFFLIDAAVDTSTDLVLTGNVDTVKAYYCVTGT